MDRQRTGRTIVLVLPALNVGLWLLWLLWLPGAGDGRPALARQVLGEILGSTVVILFAVAGAEAPCHESFHDPWAVRHCGFLRGRGT